MSQRPVQPSLLQLNNNSNNCSPSSKKLTPPFLIFLEYTFSV
jgi:hypothetical protein